MSESNERAWWGRPRTRPIRDGAARSLNGHKPEAEPDDEEDADEPTYREPVVIAGFTRPLLTRESESEP